MIEHDMYVSLPPDGELHIHEDEALLERREDTHQELLAHLTAHLDTLPDDESRTQFINQYLKDHPLQ